MQSTKKLLKKSIKENKKHKDNLTISGDEEEQWNSQEWNQ